MNYPAIRDAVAVLGTPGGQNPLGNCSRCAVGAARALVSGVPPAGQAAFGGIDVSAEAQQDRAVLRHLILPDLNPNRTIITHREQVVWTWLDRATPGVFVFEQSADHVYVFVKHGGQIALLDPATLTFAQTHAPADCIRPSGPYPAGYLGVAGGYNYLDPAVDLDDDEDPNEDSLKIYLWGDLHAVWH